MAKKVTKTELELVLPKDVRAGMQVRVHQKIKDFNSKGEERMRIQVFEGLVIARRHGEEPGATFTVRKVTDGIGVEKTYPIYTPLIEKIEVTDRKQIRRAKLYFVKDLKKRLKSTGEKKKVETKKAE